MKRIVCTVFMLVFAMGCGKSNPPPVYSETVTPIVQSCTVNQTATGAEITCADGTSASISNGSNGLNGTNGTNGTVITEVQLCSSCKPAYPSIFPEVAFCIDNNLWGVYSANGGFLSELTPGSYSSDGINCSCNLTIGANCTVSN